MNRLSLLLQFRVWENMLAFHITLWENREQRDHLNMNWNDLSMIVLK